LSTELAYAVLTPSLFAQGKVGTDETTFIRILANNTPWYNAHIDRFYTKKRSHGLAKAIRKETSGDFERLLLALGPLSCKFPLASFLTSSVSVTPPYDYWADRLYHAMKGAGTDDKTLVYIFSILDLNEIKHVAKIFLVLSSTSCSSIHGVP